MYIAEEPSGSGYSMAIVGWEIGVIVGATLGFLLLLVLLGYCLIYATPEPVTFSSVGTAGTGSLLVAPNFDSYGQKYDDVWDASEAQHAASVAPKKQGSVRSVEESVASSVVEEALAKAVVDAIEEEEQGGDGEIVAVEEVRLDDGTDNNNNDPEMRNSVLGGLSIISEEQEDEGQQEEDPHHSTGGPVNESTYPVNEGPTPMKTVTASATSDDSDTDSDPDDPGSSMTSSNPEKSPSAPSSPPASSTPSSAVSPTGDEKKPGWKPRLQQLHEEAQPQQFTVLKFKKPPPRERP